MDDPQALEIVSALANGINAQTGGSFEVDSPYQALEIIHALYVAIRAFEMSSHASVGEHRARMPINAGKPWSKQEDRELLERLDAGRMAAMARSCTRWKYVDG